MRIEMLDSASRARRSLIWRPPTMVPSCPTSGLVDAAKTTDIVGSSTWIGVSRTGSMRHVNMSPMSASSTPTTAQMSPACALVGLDAAHALERVELLDVRLVAAAVVLDDEDAVSPSAWCPRTRGRCRCGRRSSSSRWCTPASPPGRRDRTSGAGTWSMIASSSGEHVRRRRRRARCARSRRPRSCRRSGSRAARRWRRGRP